jgi:hypothetical protein
MADLTITPLGEHRFRVTVAEGGSSTTHEVLVPPATLTRLGWSGTPEELLRGSFEFLLRRERKESILPAFAIDVIGRYFPEWEAAVRQGL